MALSLGSVFPGIKPSGDPRKLWIGYICAISLILVLLLGSHVFSLSAVTASRADAEIVNVAGRQRMLSQRILLLAEKHARGPRPEIAARLIASIRLFETSHEHLIAIEDLSDATREIYFGVPDLDRRSRAYVAQARRLMLMPPGAEQQAALAELEATGLDALLLTLNDAVTSFERSARDSSDDIAQMQNIALYLAIFVLALEMALIFRPAQRLVQRTLDDLESRNAELLAARRDAQEKNAALAQAAEALAHNALHDDLTGLGNRAKLQQDIAAMLPRAHGEGRCIAVLHVDLDRFKEVNDTLGHAAGDAVLRAVSARMLERLGDADALARVGGDEFVAVLDVPADGGAEAVRWIAEDLIAAARRPVMHDGAEARVGASIGFILSASEHDDPQRLIANADIALYEAKRGGRGRANAFDATMRAELDRRARLTHRMQEALDARRFIAWHQPIASMQDGRVLGVEALARWRFPDGEVLGPADFLDVAEEAGAIERIDQLVLEAALRDLAALRADGLDAPGVAVNVSARTLRGDGFAERLAQRVAAHGLPPSDVCVEVREATLIADPKDGAAQAIAALAGMGFKTVIDDFGAGSASLASLSQLQLSGLKIHRGLIDDIEEARAQQVVAAIIGLARGLGLAVTAQGVETAAQHAVLRRLGCDAVQGFALGRPMPLDALSGWIGDYGAAPRSAPA